MKTSINLKLLAILAIGISFLMIAGCGQSGTTSPLGEYRRGTQGLEMQFTTNAPPRVVYAEDLTFPVTIEVRNKGVFPGDGDGTLNADLYYIGFDNQIITGLSHESITFQEEEAKTRFNPEGGIYIVGSEATISKSLFDQARIDSYDANIIAVLCYPYKTFAAVEVCIDPNPNRASQMGACRPGVVNAGSQGAPIAVTNVESISQRGRARFIITLSNVGGGTVLRRDDLSRCIDTDLGRTEIDKLTINQAQLSNGMPIDCTPSGDISLINNRATIVCKAEGLDENMPTFNTILQLELEYGYKKSIQRTVQIQGE